MVNSKRNFVAMLAVGAVARVSGQEPTEAPTAAPPPPPAVIPNVPAAVAVGTTGFCVVNEWEYAPRWSMPNNGFHADDQESCATQCKADAICTGATWIAYDVPGEKKNCWFKAWGTGPVATPCLPPPETTDTKTFNALILAKGGNCASIQYNGDEPLDCKDETDMFPDGGDAVLTPKGGATAPATAPAAVPSPAATPTATPTAAAPPVEAVGHTNPADLEVLGFKAFKNKDYGPTQVPAPKVPIKDLLPGHIVTSASECATVCSKDKQCNSASYYGDLPETEWPGKKNCYLKTLNGCDIPPDAEIKSDGTLFMISTAECDPEAPGAAPPFTAPVATAPAVPPALPSALPSALPPALPSAVPPALPAATDPLAISPSLATSPTPIAADPTASTPQGGVSAFSPLGSDPLPTPTAAPPAGSSVDPSTTRTFGAGAAVPPAAAGGVTAETASPASMPYLSATLAAGSAALVALLAL